MPSDAGHKPPVSEAQRRWAFGAEERGELPKGKAMEWSKRVKGKNLPEEKTAGEGLFFEKQSRPDAGRFFRDLPGRDEGDFMAKGATATSAAAPVTDMPTKEQPLGATGKPVGGFGQSGEGMSGDLYGTGAGKSAATLKREDETERLRDLLALAAGGTERKAAIEKTSAKTPNEWEADSGLPIGFHRPAHPPEEGLDGVEAGGERFFSTDVKDPMYGTGTTGVPYGVNESYMKVNPLTGHQLGKHAAALPPRFLGTPYGISKVAKDINSTAEEYAGKAGSWGGSTGSKLLSSAKKGWGQAAAKIDEGIQNVAGDPTKAGIAALVGGVLAAKGLGRLGRGGVRLLRGKPKQTAGLGQSLLGGAKRLFGGR